MRKVCPLCHGEEVKSGPDSTGLFRLKKRCYVCEGRGEVAMMPESLARNRFLNELRELERSGYQPTSGKDADGYLIVIFPEEKVKDGSL